MGNGLKRNKQASDGVGGVDCVCVRIHTIYIFSVINVSVRSVIKITPGSVFVGGSLSYDRVHAQVLLND